MKMKPVTLSYIFLCLAVCFMSLKALPQCDPMTQAECPDPENNGEICPDTLPVGFINQAYEVTATILPPASDTVQGIPIQIHHIVLDSVANLPTGLSWQSNAAGDEFFPGTYYCILMNGTPTVADTFHLKIYITVYILVLGQPFYGGQVIDSTSLSMLIVDDAGIADNRDNSFYIGKSYPNPFRTWTSIEYYSEKPGPVEFELFNLMGEMVDSRTAAALRGENYFHYQGECLPPGTYYYLLRSNGRTAAGKIVRAN
jgi:hypothetical protein